MAHSVSPLSDTLRLYSALHFFSLLFLVAAHTSVNHSRGNSEMLCVRSIQVHSLYVLRKPEILVCKQRGRGREGLTRQMELIFFLNIAYNLVF